MRSLYRLADCFGVSGIGLVASYVRSYELRGDQANGVPELCELPAPVVRRPTRFHTDHARFKFREIPEYFCASQLLARNKVTLRIHSVKLQHIPGQIQSNSCYLHDERSFAVGITACPLWHESLAD